jgi:hypothetical protein
MKSIILVLTLLLSLPALAQMTPEEASRKAERNCYWLADMCEEGAKLALNNTIEESINTCEEKMNSDLKKIACVHGVMFYFTNLNGEIELRKKARKTIPFIVYTSGHALGLTVSQLMRMEKGEGYKLDAKDLCDRFSFDNAVLDRCHEGMEAFEKVLSEL